MFYLKSEHSGFIKYTFNKLDRIISINSIIFFPRHAEENME